MHKIRSSLASRAPRTTYEERRGHRNGPPLEHSASAANMAIAYKAADWNRGFARVIPTKRFAVVADNITFEPTGDQARETSSALRPPTHMVCSCARPTLFVCRFPSRDGQKQGLCAAKTANRKQLLIQV